MQNPSTRSAITTSAPNILPTMIPVLFGFAAEDRATGDGDCVPVGIPEETLVCPSVEAVAFGGSASEVPDGYVVLGSGVARLVNVEREEDGGRGSGRGDV